MFKHLRQMKISLAAKCQLLFGAAVVLIIAAALFVPWQRMEQLIDQINQRAAARLARDAVMRHVAERTAAAGEPWRAIGQPPEPTTTTAVTVDGEHYVPPRLIGIPPRVPMDRLTQFEANAVRYFEKFPDRESVEVPPRREGQRYRYAEALYARGECLNCHAANGQTAAGGLLPAREPATRPATRPAKLIGVAVVDMPSQVEANQLLLNRIILLTAGLLAGTLAVVVFYLITTHLILQPVRVLQETAQKVSEGDLNIRSDISTGDEFQQLSETFNTMLANLKSGADQLRAINKSLDLKLGQLAETNVALYESNRLKSEFLANVSHELRTPLNSILGFADLLKDSVANDGKMTRYVQNILRSGQNLLDLINDLLDLAKIEAGRMEVRSEPLSLNDVFEGLVSLLKPMSEARELTIAASVGADVPILSTDPAKLQQVLYNFLSNAIKFSPVGGRIDLSAALEEDGRVCIAVMDQGPGIAAEKQDVIFEKFRQIDGSVTREHGGSGLGLAISKELVALLKGTIGVQSTPGEGARFWIRLPVQIEPGSHDLKGKLTLS
ncbi:MAG: HAMP domain-containing protein [Phycisphaerales bacterium]|jgi:signal transduction histidine kinase|nr:HAMP domain-containing protein [Phycisphaerales bacterium]